MTPVKVSFAPADAAAAVGRYFYQVALADSWSLDWEFGASSDDEPDAYRNSAASDPAFTVFFFVDTSDGVVKAGIPRGLNFGLKAAVEQYYRKPALVVAFLRRFLWVPAHHNVDDYQIAEPSVCLGDALPGVDGHARFPCSGQSMLWATYDLFGYRPLKEEKSTPWSSSAAPFVGTVSDFSDLRSKGLISISIKPSTRDKARDIVASALESGQLTPTDVGSLYGKLRWVFCLGRIVLGALHEIKVRQYAGPDGDGRWSLGPALSDALGLILDVLSAPPSPALVRCRVRGVKPTLVWSDAMWEPRDGLRFGFGRIGFVVKAPRLAGGYDIYFARAEVPQDFLEVLFALRSQKTFIHPLELLGIVAPYLASQLFGLWQGADVIHFGDNNAANAAAIKGNTAVEPSRDDISSLIDMGAQEIKFVFPDLLTSLREFGL